MDTQATVNPASEIGINEKSSSEIAANQKGANLMYLSFTGGFFIALFVIFLFFPRPTFSELEKRDLESFPDFEEYRDNPAGYTEGISNWFSNTQPFRDDFLTLSMNLRNVMKYSFRDDEDVISFVATADEIIDAAPEEVYDDFAETEEHDADNLIAENAKIGNSGVVVAGTAPNARAMMAYGGGAESGNVYISTVNNYAAAFPNANIFVVIANTSGEFYMPSKVTRNKPQTPTLQHVKEGIAPRVKYVDVHAALDAHKTEDIFSRTDHHWAPLGAYYAAKAFAQTANLPFKNLDSYDKHVIHGYVGSMYGYSKDINVKNSPEDFIYYTPNNIDYKASFITYKANEKFQITSTHGPYESEFFKTFKDGNGNAYCTFMGTDQCTVHVKTATENGRRLLIIKDSYGNAVPGYLFYSFSDIHIVDFRYFNRNIKKYVAENGITDIAFIFGIFNVCNSNTFNRVNRFLNLEDGQTVAPLTAPASATNEKKVSSNEKDKEKENDVQKVSEKKVTTEEEKVVPTETKETQEQPEAKPETPVQETPKKEPAKTEPTPQPSPEE